MPGSTRDFILERLRFATENQAGLTYLAAGTLGSLTDSASDVELTNQTVVDQSAVNIPTRDLRLLTLQTVIRGAVTGSPTGVTWALYEAPNGVGQVTPEITTEFATVTSSEGGFIALIDAPWIRSSEGASALGTEGSLYWRGALDTASATAANVDVRLRFAMPSTETSINPAVT